MFSKKLSIEQIHEVHDKMRATINSDIEEVIAELQSKGMEISSSRWNRLVSKREELEASRRTLDLFVQKLQTERVR